jgi:BA14K-like protein
MNFATKTLLFSAMCATLCNAGAATVSAHPGGGPTAMRATAAQTAGIVDVQYRGRSYDRGRYRGNDGRNIGLGIAGLVIGGIILSEAARAEHRNSNGGDWQRCAQTYRSFERDSGMYTGYDGIRRPCPYLN